MLRDLICHESLAVDATFKAAQKMTTGAGVVQDYATKEVDFPTEATADNIVWVQKDRVALGYKANVANLSDYDEDFVTVAEGEKLVCYVYPVGCTFATDQFADTLTDGDMGKTLAVNAEGKVEVATAASKYEFRGFYMDAGKHKLARIYVLDAPKANA